MRTNNASLAARKKAVFNLEFPSRCKTLTVGGYKFERVDDYQNALGELQHRIDMTDEFTVKKCTGGHAVTAYAETPQIEESAVLDWGNGSKAMSDVLMLLCLFTGRDVFAQDLDKLTTYMNIPYDQRVYIFGGILQCSLSYKASSSDLLTCYDAGFQDNLNSVYELIKDLEWQRTFKGGNYLRLAWSSVKSRSLETAFLSSWTIWEHLFCILNEDWLAAEQIEKMSSAEKISFLLVKYAFKTTLDKAAKNRLLALSTIRNRLVHYGFFPERDEVRKDAELFVHMTEFLVAKTLGLLPSNVFNTMEKFEAFLAPPKPAAKSQKKQQV
jgi:hypothetical protein